MSSVDERIVDMKIQNGQFLSGVKSSLGALTSLNKGIEGAGGKGMGGLGATVDGVQKKFSLLRAAALGAAASVGYNLVNAGVRFVKSFTLDPIMAGFHSYETTINATKTIMANTGASAKTTGKYLNDLQGYANKTVYNFGEMAKNIGTFTAAGVKLPTATAAIKGVANMAALSGSTSAQASSAMYQLSQALAAGQIHLQDWNSVVNAGMGGKKLQSALATTADALGKTVNIGTKAAPQMVKVTDAVGKYGKSFRDVISAGGIDAKTMSTTLKIMSGDMTKAQIRALGFSKTQTAMMYKMSQTALHSATNIKTFSQLTEALKEEVATAWGSIFKTVFGGLGSATKMFSAIHTVAENAFTAPLYGLNRLLQGWAKLGGRTAVIKGFINIWKSLSAIFGAVAAAWEQVFPPSSGKMLADISKGFQDLTAHLIPSHKAIKDLTAIFKAVFMVLGAGAVVIGSVFKYFFSLITLFTDNGGGAATGILDIAASVARLITGFLQMTNLSGRISDFFDHIIAGRAKLFGPIIKAVGDVIKAIDPLLHGDMSGFGAGLKKALGDLAPVGKVISGLGSHMSDVFTNIQNSTSGIVSKIAGYFVKAANSVKHFGDEMANAFAGVKSGASGSLGSAASMLAGFGNSLSHAFDAFKGGGAKSATESTIKLASAATNLGHGGNILVTVMKTVGVWVGKASVAIAQGIGNIWSAVKGWVGHLDKIDLVTAFSYILNGAILVMVYKFIHSLKGFFDGFREIGENVAGAFGQLTGTLKTMQQGVRAKIIMNIAIAVGILAGSLFLLAKLPNKQLATGLAAISTILAEVVGTMALLGKGKLGDFAQKNIMGMAAALVLMSYAMIQMAVAVGLFGRMKISTLAKGLGAMAIALGILVAASLGLSKVEGPIVRAAAALVIMSLALEMLSGVILTFSAIDWGTFTSGMVKMGVALGVIVVAMNAMPTDKMLGNSVGMVAIATAMVILAGAIAAFGNMDTSTIAKGLLTMSAALAILVVAVSAMEGTLPGAAAMLVVSGAMVVLATALAMMGNQSWGSILKSLTLLSAALIILIAAGAGLEAFGAGLLILGAAVALVGVGMLAAGVGMMAFAAGLTVLVGLGTAAFGVITVAIQVFLAMLPAIALQVAAAFVAFIQAIANASPKIANAFVKIITNMINAAQRLLPKIVHLVNLFIGQMLSVVDKNAPKFGHTLQIMINTGIRVLSNSVPKIINLGFKIIDSFLSALDKHVPKIANSASDIIVKFINGISHNLPRIIAAGTNLLIKFIQGVGKSSGKIVNAAGETVLKFLNALNAAINKYQGPIQAAAGRIGVSIGRGVISGIGSMAGQAATAAANLAHRAISALHGAIKNPPFPSRVGIGIGYSLAYGFTNGIVSGAPGAESASAKMAQNTIDAAKKALDSHSPSQVFHSIGLDVGRGFVNGIQASLNAVKAAGMTMAKEAIDTVTKTTTDLQLKADAQSSRAAGIRAAASLLTAKAHAKHISKASKKSLEAQAKKLNKIAAAIDKKAKGVQASVDSVNAAADRATEFAAADDQGKADIQNQHAADAAALAETRRKNAMKLAAEADAIRKKDAKRARALDKEAQTALKNAESASNAAKSYALSAQGYVAKAVLATVADVQKQLNDDKAATELAVKLAGMTQQQQADYYTAQAKADKATSDAKYAAAQALLTKATTEAKTNANQAKLDVAAAQQDVTDAEAAKQAADEASSQASQILSQITEATPTQADLNLKMPDTTIASSLVYGAQNMFDAYAKTLNATQDAAQEKQPITFVQNNTSPVALSPSTVYRQSKNLLSDAERKLAGAGAR